MGRRFLIGYITGYVLFLGAFIATLVVQDPPVTGTAGEAQTGGLPPRIGWVVFVMIVPALLGAGRLSKLRDRGSPAHVVIPILLALALFVITFIAGFMPDEVGCGLFDIERFGDPNPRCFTSTSVRMGAAVEATITWVLFGLATVAFRTVRRRRELKRKAALGR
ncbi:MAG: hypothetical protein ACRDKZ_09695 [Actinomycetota bacterium]